MNTKNFKEKPKSILEFSRRTVAKILRRANHACSICSWNEAQCDIHHIVHKQNGGNDTMENLVCVCPNCHRKLHEFGEKFKSTEELLKVSLEKTLPNWKDYYNPDSPSSYACTTERHEDHKNYCKCCQIEIPIDNIYCSISCSSKANRKFSFTKEDISLWKKENLSMVKIGKRYGVSDNAIRKRLKKMGLYDYFRE